MPDRISNLAAHDDLQVEWFAADYKFLLNLLPSNNSSIGGSISLNQDPVIKLTDEQALHLQDDFHRLRDRMDNCHLLFHRELMGSLCLTMMYDIFEAHAQRESTDSHTDRTAYIVKQLMTLHSLTSAATAPSILASPPANTDRVFNRNNTRSYLFAVYLAHMLSYCPLIQLNLPLVKIRNLYLNLDWTRYII